MTVTITGDALYELLPAELRRRDQEADGAVRAIAEVIADQLAAVDADVERLGEDWFIETCPEWVVPYIGDLLRVTGVHQVTGAVTTAARARVANTLRYRRRKGTLAMLEQLARDTTGWPAKAVEFFELLSATQHLNHLRLHRPASADLRRGDALELAGSAFDTFAHTVDVRPMAGRQGWFNIPNIGLFVWPTGSYRLDRATTRPVADPDDGRYLIDPLGGDRPLFMPPATETDIEHFAEEENVPGLLRRRPLYAELEEWRAAVAVGGTPPARFFGPRAVFRVFAAAAAGDPLAEIPPERLQVCDLTTWRRPTQTGHAMIDPVLGRVSFPAGQVPDRVRVSSAYGAAGDVGAGTYSRREALAGLLDRPVDWQAGVRIPEPGEPAEPELFADLAAAVTAWNTWQATHPDSFGLITVMENHRYVGDLTGGARIQVGAGSKLAIVAAHWPKVAPADGGPAVRKPGRIEPTGLRPCVAGKIEVQGTAADTEVPGELVIDGLLVDGELRVVGLAPANLGRLVLGHTTLVPGRGGLKVNSANPRLSVELRRCVTGPVELPETVRRLRVAESVVQAEMVRALDTPHTALDLDGCTVLGATAAKELSASNTLFTAKAKVEREQTGCVRFSYVPPGSQTPRRHRCQPETAIEQASQTGEPAAHVTARLVPTFVSENYGHFGYAQLAPEAAPELATGADDASEIGVFGISQRAARIANLTGSLDEYLPFGLDAAPLPVTPHSRSEQ